jgi:hypothetical protein
VGRALAKVSRYGLADYGCYDKFCDELVEHLKGYIEHEDEAVKDVASAIARLYFPEVFGA